MSSGSERIADLLLARDAIVEATPEMCQPCDRPIEKANTLAIEVVAGKLTVEQAQELQWQDMTEHCVLGPAYEAGCDGATVTCGYGGKVITELELIATGIIPSQGISTD